MAAVGVGLASQPVLSTPRETRQAAATAFLWHTMPLPVSVDALAAAAGVPSPAAPELFLCDLIRVIHERPVDPDRAPDSPLANVLSALRQVPATQGDSRPHLLPLPLSPDTWAGTVLERPVAPVALAEAILANRRASMLYLGLSALDAETLAAVGRDRGLLTALARDHAAVLAAFGRSVSIRDGVVVLPLAAETRGAWEALVGAPASDPARFLPALLGKDRGRLAYFLDTIVRLDEPHRRFVMGVRAPDATSAITATAGNGEPGRPGALAAAAGLAAAYEPVRAGMSEWNADVHPFYRPPFDPADALRRVQVTDEGLLRPPSSRQLWEQVYARWSMLGAPGARSTERAEADAPWLLSQWLGSSYRDASVKLDQMTIAQRVFANASPSDAAALQEALEGIARRPALALVLERLGISDPARFVTASTAASAITSRASRRDGYAALSLFQGLLAIVERARWAGTLDQARAIELGMSLLELSAASGDEAEAQLVTWLERTLLPALGAITGVPPGPRPDQVVLSALAGVRRDALERAPVVVEWEGQPYRLDVAEGDLARLTRFHERLAPPSLTQVLTLHRSAQALAQSGDPTVALAQASRVLSELDVALPSDGSGADLRQSLERADRAVARARGGGPGQRLGGSGLRDLARFRTVLAADVIRSLAYLPSLGPPDGAARLGGHVARRHRFDVPDPANTAADAPWSLPREQVTEEEGWHVRGSLLGLDVGLARLALRRLDVDRVPLNPSLDDATRRRLAVAVVLSKPGDVTNTTRDRIADALARGRLRVKNAAAEDGGLMAVATALGLDAGRRHSLAWAVEQLSADPLTRFSIGEILRLGTGAPPPFSVGTVPQSNCLAGSATCGLELSDLALHLTDGLAARGLPPALLPGLLASATQDVIDDAQSVHAGDEAAIWEAIRRLGRERLDDHVSALAGSGPLVFTKPASVQRSR